MKAKFFYINQHGKIELEPKELEALIDEAYNEGVSASFSARISEHKCENHCKSEIDKVNPETDAHAEYPIAVNVPTPVDVDKAVEAIKSLMNEFGTLRASPSDCYSKLKKELNF